MGFQFFGALLRSSSLRRLLLALVVALALALGWTAKSFSQPRGGGTYILYTDGMMQPETITVPGPGGRVIKYSDSRNGKAFMVMVNGRPWLLLSDDGKQLLISDPNGVKGRVIIKASVTAR